MSQKKKNSNAEDTVKMLPYERFLQLGQKAVSDEELLAIILRTGAKGEDALSLACNVLKRCGREHGLLGLYHLSVDELCAIRGIGEVKAVKLKAIAELSERIANTSRSKDICFRSPLSVAEAYMERMRHLENEVCIAVFLDTGDCRIEDRVMSQGDLSGTLICSREIFRHALKLNASSVIILHNHPSGDPAPSKQDLAITARLLEAARFLEIPVLDHIIIGDRSYYSMKEKGVL